MLAQIPNSTAGEIGGWLVGLAAVVGILVLVVTGINQWRQMISKPPKMILPRADQYVTRAELEKVEQALGDKIDKYEEYSRKRIHELADSVNTLGLKLAHQPTEMRTMIDSAIAPLHRKIDMMQTAVAAMLAKMGSGPHILEQVPPEAPE